MKDVVTFKYHEYTDVFIELSQYTSNNRLAVRLINRNEGSVALLTVNLSEERNVKSNEAFIDTNNVPDALEFITQNDLGIIKERVGYSGFCHYPMVAFNRKLFNCALDSRSIATPEGRVPVRKYLGGDQYDARRV